MATTMQYKQVLEMYQQLLEGNPGKALVIGEGLVAILEGDWIFWAPLGLDGKPEVSSASDFDQSSFVSEDGRWDGETPEQLLVCIQTPVFLDLQ